VRLCLRQVHPGTALLFDASGGANLISDTSLKQGAIGASPGDGMMRQAVPVTRTNRESKRLRSSALLVANFAPNASMNILEPSFSSTTAWVFGPLPFDAPFCGVGLAT